MPLDPDKMRQVTEKSETLSKRMDALMERRKINDSQEEDEDEDIDIEPTEENSLVDPAEAAMRATPGTDLADPNVEDEPWFE
jgi:hypothetical protein